MLTEKQAQEILRDLKGLPTEKIEKRTTSSVFYKRSMGANGRRMKRANGLMKT